MSFRYEEKSETSDIIFTASGETLEELFSPCWDTAVRATVEHLEAVDAKEKREIELEDEGSISRRLRFTISSSTRMPKACGMRGFSWMSRGFSRGGCNDEV